MQLGRFRLTTISGGRFRLDGGAMFGVIPQPLWSRRLEPDGRKSHSAGHQLRVD